MLVICFVATLAHGFQASEGPRERQLNANSWRMRISFELERQEYYPGEEMAAKIRITNPADIALEIPDPEDPAHVRIGMTRFQPVAKGAAVRESYIDHFTPPFLGADPRWSGSRRGRRGNSG